MSGLCDLSNRLENYRYGCCKRKESEPESESEPISSNFKKVPLERKVGDKRVKTIDGFVSAKSLIPSKIDGLTEEQKCTISDFDCGYNIFLSGMAGSGKSFLTNKMYKKAVSRYGADRVQMCGTTGQSSLQLRSGCTLHSFFGLKPSLRFFVEVCRYLSKERKEVMGNLSKCRVLFIDEISMLPQYLLEWMYHLVLIAKVGELAPRSEEGYQVSEEQIKRYLDTSGIGGDQLQWVVVGDFCQLPPVPNRDLDSTLKQGFCFNSPVWKTLGLDKHSHYLSHNFRQGESTDRFRSLLLRMRTNTLNTEDMQFLQDHVVSANNKIPSDFVCIFPLRKEVDSYNAHKLMSLSSKTGHLYHPKVIGEQHTKELFERSITNGQLDTLNLRKGARVVFTVNMRKVGIVNGTTATVVDFLCSEAESVDDYLKRYLRCKKHGRTFTRNYLPDTCREEYNKTLHDTDLGAQCRSSIPNPMFYMNHAQGWTDVGEMPLLRLDRAGKCRYVLAGPYQWQFTIAGVVVLTVYQLPLRLAWARTIHGAQGMEFTCPVFVSLRKCFSPSQAYVGISRVCKESDLYLDMVPTQYTMRVAKESVAFYEKLIKK